MGKKLKNVHLHEMIVILPTTEIPDIKDMLVRQIKKRITEKVSMAGYGFWSGSIKNPLPSLAWFPTENCEIHIAYLEGRWPPDFPPEKFYALAQSIRKYCKAVYVFDTSIVEKLYSGWELKDKVKELIEEILADISHSF